MVARGTAAGGAAGALGPPAADRLRKVNLIEVLREDAEAGGLPCGALREDEQADMLSWSEGDIRAFFASGGSGRPPVLPGPHAAVPPAAGATATRAACAPAPAGAAATSCALPHAPHAPLTRWPPPPQGELLRWFPALGRAAAGSAPARGPAAGVAVLAFPNSGSAEDMYSSEGTGARRARSPLLDWCCTSGASLLAVQPPGRALRAGEPPAPTLPALAAHLLPVAAAALAGAARYYVIGHSVGAWMAYEFLQAARTAGLPMPAAAFLSAMPPPDIPERARPWRRQAALSEANFKDECRAWGINEAAFSGALWPAYQPLLRADFRLFDEYVHRHDASSPPFDFPITAYWGERDPRVTEAMVQGWARFTRGPFRLVMMPSAGHLWPAGGDKESKATWLAHIVREMEQGVGR